MYKITFKNEIYVGKKYNEPQKITNYGPKWFKMLKMLTKMQNPLCPIEYIKIHQPLYAGPIKEP